LIFVEKTLKEDKKQKKKHFIQLDPHCSKIKATEGKAPPSEVYADLVSKPPASIVRQLVDAPRDVKQCKNSQSNQRDVNRISRDSIFELSELYYEIDFISGLILFPTFNCLCFHKVKYLSQISYLILNMI
jgi:hypothetical protein